MPYIKHQAGGVHVFTVQDYSFFLLYSSATLERVLRKMMCPILRDVSQYIIGPCSVFFCKRPNVQSINIPLHASLLMDPLCPLAITINAGKHQETKTQHTTSLHIVIT